jgi:hypothetical protein
MGVDVNRLLTVFLLRHWVDLVVDLVFSNPGLSLKEEFAAGSFDGSLLE